MPSSPVRTRLRRLASIAAALALAAASVVTASLPASAHDELVSTDPGSGVTVDALPALITLTFNGALLGDLDGNQVEVTDASGDTLAAGDPLVAGNVVTQALTGSADGAVSVAWRVVSEDGHPISGEFAFTVAGPASPAPTSTSTSTPPASAAEVATPSPSTTPVAAASQPSPVPWIVLGAVLIAAAGGVVYLLVSGGRRPPEPPAESVPDR